MSDYFRLMTDEEIKGLGNSNTITDEQASEIGLLSLTSGLTVLYEMMETLNTQQNGGSGLPESEQKAPLMIPDGTSLGTIAVGVLALIAVAQVMKAGWSFLQFLIQLFKLLYDIYSKYQDYLDHLRHYHPESILYDQGKNWNQILGSAFNYGCPENEPVVKKIVTGLGADDFYYDFRKCHLVKKDENNNEFWLSEELKFNMPVGYYQEE